VGTKDGAREIGKDRRKWNRAHGGRWTEEREGRDGRREGMEGRREGKKWRRNGREVEGNLATRLFLKVDAYVVCMTDCCRSDI